MTLAPCSCRKIADDTPERPSPTTRTLLFFNSIGFFSRVLLHCDMNLSLQGQSVCLLFRMTGCSSGSPWRSAKRGSTRQHGLEDSGEALLLPQGRLVMLDHVAHRH